MTLGKKILTVLFILFVAFCLSACATSQVKEKGAATAEGSIYGGSGYGQVGYGETDLSDGSAAGTGVYVDTGWGDFTGPQARQKFTNEDVHFLFDSTALSPSARGILDMKAKWMQVNPGVNVIIEGHCDNRGTAEYNLALGEARAAVVRDYMAALGISATRMEIVSYGEEFPVVDGEGEAAWAQNRRAHFSFPQ